MSATKARALICAALAVAAFFALITIANHQDAAGIAAFCDVRTMSCFDKLGSSR